MLCTCIVCRGGSEKRHLTVLLTCTADGQFPPPMVVFKGKTIKNLIVPEGFVAVTQEKGWMDDKLMMKYIDEIWMAHVLKTGCKESLLTLDSFRAHISESSKKKFHENDVHTCVIPGGCTSVLQPLDVCLNKPFKAHLRHCWQQYMLQETEKLEGSEKTKIPPAPRQEILNWIETAWKAIKEKPDQISKSFVVTGIGTVNGKWEESLIRNEELRQEIEQELFGSEQLPCAPDGDPFDQFSSDFNSDSDSTEHIGCTGFSICGSEDSMSCGEYSEIMDIDST